MDVSLPVNTDLHAIDFAQSFKAGEPRVLDAIYRAYSGEIAHLIRRLLSKHPKVSLLCDCDDLLQDTFARAFATRSRHLFDGSREYGPFLRAIAHNLLIDRIRSSRRELRVDDPDEILDAQPQVPNDDPFDGDERAALVEGYVAGLCPLLAAVYQRRHVECRSQNSVCLELGVTRQHLRTLEKHLRDGLKRFLKRSGLRTVQPNRSTNDDSEFRITP